MNTTLPDSSRVWIYQSQTEIAKDVQESLQRDMKLFVSNWANHGKGLHGDSFILENYFIILVVDESKINASGCSIDSSTRFLKEMEKKYNLSLMNRLQVLTELNGKKEIVHYSDIQDNPDRLIYNPLISTLGELRNNWKIKVTDFS